MNEANCPCSGGETASPRRALSKFPRRFLSAKIREAVVQAVVGQPAALAMGKAMALFQRGDERGKAVDVHIAGAAAVLPTG